MGIVVILLKFLQTQPSFSPTDVKPDIKPDVKPDVKPSLGAPPLSPSKTIRSGLSPIATIGFLPVKLTFPSATVPGGRGEVLLHCLPSSSGLVVHYQYEAKKQMFATLKEEIDILMGRVEGVVDLPANTLEYRIEDLREEWERVKVEMKDDAKEQVGGVQVKKEIKIKMEVVEDKKVKAESDIEANKRPLGGEVKQR